MDIKNSANLLINFTIKRLAEIFGVIVSSCGIFLLIALLSYSVEDPNFIFPSDTKLPWKPIKFSIFVFSGKIKFGSLGEYVINASNSIAPAKEIKIPNISANLLMVK